MRRVQANDRWTFFCPSQCPKLLESSGEEFDQIYERYEHILTGSPTVRALQIWDAILKHQLESPRLSIVYKDALHGR